MSEYPSLRHRGLGSRDEDVAPRGARLQAAEHGPAIVRRRIGLILFAVSGLLPLMGLLASPPSPTLLIYSLFVLDVLRRRRRERRGRRESQDVQLQTGQQAVPDEKAESSPDQDGSAVTWRRPIRFWLSVVGAGAITECLAWTDNFLKCAEAPGLMHPQLLPDLIHGVGFYSTWAIAWLWLLRRYRFTLRQIFVTQGIYGILIEQNGQIFLAGLAMMPVGLVFWLYVFLVYGSTIGIPYNRYESSLLRDDTGGGRRKYLVALLALFLVIVPVGAGWSLAVTGLGLNPPKGPICERPLW